MEPIPGSAFINAAQHSAAGQRTHSDEARLSAILDGIGDGFWALDWDWRLIDFNRAAEAFFDQSRADVLGRPVWDAYPMLVGSEFERRDRRAMAERITESFEAPSATRPGRWLEVRAFPIPGGLGVAFRDGTDRHRAEQGLISSEAHLAAIFTEAAAGFAESDLDGRFLRVNDRYCEIVGRTREDLLGRLAHAGRHPPGRLRPEPVARAGRDRCERAVREREALGPARRCDRVG